MAAVVLLSGAVQAGLVNFTANVPFELTPSGDLLLHDVLSSRPSVITMTAEFSSPPVQAGGVSSSMFHVTLKAQNDLGWTWTGYILELLNPPEAEFMLGSALCDVFCLTSQSKDELIWSEPPSVSPGGSATFDFDVIISPGSGSYTFELKQTPVPEPATIALLGLGVVVLLTRRKRQ